ncbi:MAG: DUF5020 family protein [Campylobacterales bacterium]|nr:DUF5020 family protein [Campylobacterales bacterium]
MKKVLLFLFFSSISLVAFETTNVQLLYGGNFKGDAFIYDTQDGKKTTVTFEHFRTFSYGDFYMFVDMMDGKKFDGTEQDVYTEVSPRLSLSKISGSNFSSGILKDVFIATQINKGKGYVAYLGGLGADFEIPGFNVFSLNLYYKSENIENDSFQFTPVYISKEFYGVHFEGFVDVTSRDINTQNQLLYNLDALLGMKEKVYLGTEWIYYDYNHNGTRAKTSVAQVMIKYQF